MITVPVYDLLMLPDVTFFLKKDMFSMYQLTSQNIGNDVLFLMLKSNKKREELTENDIYSLGVAAKIDNVDEEGNVRIRTCEKVEISALDIKQDILSASAVISQEIADITEEEERDRLNKLKRALMSLAQGFQWGMWIRGTIYHWKSFNEIICTLSGYMNLSVEEKYSILASPTKKTRIGLIEKAVYQFIEFFKVGKEAEEERQESNKTAYREAAIKRQMQFLQKELDGMHPENVSDIRKFEKKIEESGMTDEARGEAEKILNRMKQEGKDSHEYGTFYDYLDFITSLAWKNDAISEINLDEAREILDEEHYGLKKVKRRIIQQLAVMTLRKKQSGTILLFVGPPGTGKTSIGQSIAKALLH